MTTWSSIARVSLECAWDSALKVARAGHNPLALFGSFLRLGASFTTANNRAEAGAHRRARRRRTKARTLLRASQSGWIDIAPHLRQWVVRQLAGHHSRSTLTMATGGNQGSWKCPQCAQWRKRTAYFCHRCCAPQPTNTDTYWADAEWQDDSSWTAPWRHRRHRSPRPKDQRPFSPRGHPPKGGKGQGGKDKGGKGKGQQSQELLAALPPPPPSITSSSVKMEPGQPSNVQEDGNQKMLEVLFAALHKQDKTTLTPELQRLLEEQRLSSAKQLTKSLHQATSKQGAARKSLQKLRDERVAFLSSWDQYLERLVALLKQQTAEKEKTLADYQARESVLVETIRAAVQDIANLQTAMAEPGQSVAISSEDSDELMPIPETKDNDFLQTLENALQTSKATTRLFSGKRKTGGEDEATSEGESAAKVAKAATESAQKRLEEYCARALPASGPPAITHGPPDTAAVSNDATQAGPGNAP